MPSESFEKDEWSQEASLLSHGEPQQATTRKWFRLNLDNAITAVVLLLVVSLYCLQTPYTSPEALSVSETLAQCSWKTLEKHTSLLDVAPISRDEFLARQAKLAAKLEEAGVDAFIAEPSASSAYYANISDSYELSERPFLMILDKKGHFSYLAPKFELGRIAGLEMVYEEKRVIEWPEEVSPYETLKKATGYGKVMLDEHVRYMIAAGLQATGIEVVPMTEEIESLRAVKSAAELAILRGINEFTVELVRSLQRCITVGMSRDDVLSAAEALFTQAGVGKGFWALVLFGEEAASPHGGSKGKTLSDGEFVLIDIGSSLYSYGSDVTRTFLPSKSKVSKELLDIWHLVRDSQTAAIAHMKVNMSCSTVDAASRANIKAAGYGEYYTHRLGHGLGLEMHEHPYLNGANHDKLKAGHVVTNEPGIYVTTEQAQKLNKDVGFGVRIEDAVLVTEDGGVVLTRTRAKSPYEP